MSVAPKPGLVLVVSAPSGTGKTTVCHAVVSRDAMIVLSVSHTTRAPRSGERDGVEYHFVSRSEFDRLARAGAFVEHASYNDNLYGTSWAALEKPRGEGRDVLLEIEVQGGAQVRARLPDAVLVFLVPPSFEALEQRLRGRRTDAPEVIERRLAIARQEMEAVVRYDYVVVNDEVERAAEAVLEIVRAEREGRRDGVRARHGREAVLPRLAGRLPLPAAAAPGARPER